MAKSIDPGTYTVEEILKKAGFDHKAKSATHENPNGDPRRITVGNLPFHELDEKINVPAAAEELVVALDGKTAVVLKVNAPK